MQAFLRPITPAERQAQLLRMTAEYQQHADELRAKRKLDEASRRKPGRPKKQQRADDTGTFSEAVVPLRHRQCSTVRAQWLQKLAENLQDSSSSGFDEARIAALIT